MDPYKQCRSDIAVFISWLVETSNQKGFQPMKEAKDVKIADLRAMAKFLAQFKDEVKMPLLQYNALQRCIGVWEKVAIGYENKREPENKKYFALVLHELIEDLRHAIAHHESHEQPPDNSLMNYSEAEVAPSTKSSPPTEIDFEFEREIDEGENIIFLCFFREEAARRLAEHVSDLWERVDKRFGASAIGLLLSEAAIALVECHTTHIDQRLGRPKEFPDMPRIDGVFLFDPRDKRITDEERLMFGWNKFIRVEDEGLDVMWKMKLFVIEPQWSNKIKWKNGPNFEEMFPYRTLDEEFQKSFEFFLNLQKRPKLNTFDGVMLAAEVMLQEARSGSDSKSDPNFVETAKNIHKVLKDNRPAFLSKRFEQLRSLLGWIFCSARQLQGDQHCSIEAADFVPETSIQAFDRFQDLGLGRPLVSRNLDLCTRLLFHAYGMQYADHELNVVPAYLLYTVLRRTGHIMRQWPAFEEPGTAQIPALFDKDQPLVLELAYGRLGQMLEVLDDLLRGVGKGPCQHPRFLLPPDFARDKVRPTKVVCILLEYLIDKTDRKTAHTDMFRKIDGLQTEDMGYTSSSIDGAGVIPFLEALETTLIKEIPALRFDWVTFSDRCGRLFERINAELESCGKRPLEMKEPYKIVGDILHEAIKAEHFKACPDCHDSRAETPTLDIAVKVLVKFLDNEDTDSPWI